MYKKIFNNLVELEAFENSSFFYWNDPYISQNLLRNHLQENQDSASRNFKFMHESVLFMQELFKNYDVKDYIDFGCGPGLYCNLLKTDDLNITGVDLSERSIAYAKSINSNINYKVGNYLEFKEKDKYDFASLIYCDYGSLNKNDRIKLLNNIYGSLKENGYFLLDVFSLEKFLKFKERKTWIMHKSNSFWSEESNLEIINDEIYPNFISLNQSLIITEDIKSINRWYQYFSLDMIKEELEVAGFKLIETYSSVKGDSYTEDSDTIALLVMK